MPKTGDGAECLGGKGGRVTSVDTRLSMKRLLQLMVKLKGRSLGRTSYSVSSCHGSSIVSTYLHLHDDYQRICHELHIPDDILERLDRLDGSDERHA